LFDKELIETVFTEIDITGANYELLDEEGIENLLKKDEETQNEKH
jgi:hypothetical protein